MRLFRRNPTGRACAGAPIRFGSLIWNNQTALAKAATEHPAQARRVRAALFRGSRKVNSKLLHVGRTTSGIADASPRRNDHHGLFRAKRRFRRSLRELMRPTFGAAKVGKTARAAKAPGKLRRVPCVSHSERPVPNSLPLVAQTCGTGNPRSLLRYSAPSRQMGGRRTLGACRDRSPYVMSPHPAVAAAEHCRAGRKKGRRMSERRERKRP